MEEKHIKIYSTILGAIGLLIAVFQFLKLNDIRGFVEDNHLTGVDKPSFILNYVFLLLLTSILISLFILVYFGVKSGKKDIEDISLPDIDDKQIEDSLKNKKSIEERELVEKKIQLVVKDLEKLEDKKTTMSSVLRRLASEFSIVQGLGYLKSEGDKFKLAARYAYYVIDKEPEIVLGEGLAGQVALDKEPLYVNNIPDNYITVFSGLGSSTPKYLIIFPIVKDQETIALFEFAAFSDFSSDFKLYADSLNRLLSAKL